jgi:hypothetical protein
VKSAVDADRGDGGPLQRREQHAPECVADGDSEAALQGLAGELAVEVRRRLRLDGDALGADEVAPVTARHGQRHVVLLVLGFRATVSMGGGTNSARLTRGLPAFYFVKFKIYLE